MNRSDSRGLWWTGWYTAVLKCVRIYSILVQGGRGDLYELSIPKSGKNRVNLI